jgi:hypothetical protein
MISSDTTTALLIGTFIGLAAAYVAHRKKRNPYLWFFVGFFFGLFGLFFFIFLPQKKKTPKKTAPQPFISGPSDKFWYFLDKSNEQVGPMSYIALSKHWKEGEIGQSTFIWHEDLTDWKPLEDLIRMREAP